MDIEVLMQEIKIETEISTDDTDGDDKVTLMPLAMRVPNKEYVYSPHPFKKPLVISKSEFLARFSDNPDTIKVSFDEHPKSDTIHLSAKVLTAYGEGNSSWYILAENS